jgi:hypothetical protein
MSQGGYTHTTRATGTVLTAAIYNNDHQNHITNQNPQMTGAYSDTLTQYQLATDPGTLGAESFAATLAGEIERLRFQIRSISGETQWYTPPARSLKSITGISDNSLPLSSLANTTQGKILMRTAAGVGPWQESDIPSLSALSPPAAGDFVLGAAAAGGAPRRILVSDMQASSILEPQGRLTLSASTPVMTSNVLAATTVRYTPYKGVFCPVWNGSVIIAANTGGELSQATTDTTKSPAATVANKNYDVFFWMDGATPRATRGPGWATDTTRGTGAGTTELTRVGGILVNAQVITNGPAANRGTYLGTVRTNASNQVDFMNNQLTSVSPARMLVWNAYNRIMTPVTMKDPVASFTPGNTGGIRPIGNNVNHRIEFLRGLDEDTASFTLSIRCQVPNGGFYIAGIGLDSGNAFGGTGTSFAQGIVEGPGFAVGATLYAQTIVLTALGFHIGWGAEAANGSMTIFLDIYELLKLEMPA